MKKIFSIILIFLMSYGVYAQVNLQINKLSNRGLYEGYFDVEPLTGDIVSLHLQITVSQAMQSLQIQIVDMSPKVDYWRGLSEPMLVAQNIVAGQTIDKNIEIPISLDGVNPNTCVFVFSSAETLSENIDLQVSISEYNNDKISDSFELPIIDNVVIVEGNIAVYSISGKLIDKSVDKFDLSKLQSGVYVVVSDFGRFVYTIK